MQYGTSVVEAWLPADDPALGRYKEFRERFGSDQFLIVSWPDCDLDDPRLPAMVEALQQLATDSPELKIASIQDSATLVRQLSGNESSNRDQRQVALSLEDIQRRLGGFAIGRDGVCFITMRLATRPSMNQSQVIREVQACGARILGPQSKDLVLAGEPYQVHMIDQSSRSAMRLLVAPSTMLALLLAWLCLRSWGLTLLVFSLAGTGQLIGMAMISIFVGEMAAVLVVVPTLVFMLTLSAAVHLTNYFVDNGGFRKSTSGVRALRLGATPCVLATLTTVFGFASLSVSQLAPVWQFGTLSAMSLILASAVLLCTFPAATLAFNYSLDAWRSVGLRRLTGRPKPEVSPRSEEIADARRQLRQRNLGERPIWWLANWTRRQSTPITLIGLGCLAISLIGLTRLKTSTEFEDMFSQNSDAVRSLHWVREHIGPINSLEFLLRVPSTDNSGSESDLLNELATLERIQQQLLGLERVEGVLSAVSFLPALPQGEGTRNTVRRAVLRRILESRLGELEEQNLLSVGDEERVWRLTIRVRGLRGENYPAIRDTLQDTAGKALQESLQARPNMRASTELTGLRTVVENAHNALITDLASSFAAAFALITPVMMLIVRGALSGLILMIPNLLPVALVFGGMGWLGIPLDVASILTASVALGIAVDDTLHFLTWYFRSRSAGDSAEQAVRKAITACARPMTHTTLICSGAMLPFFFSQFLPTSKFALLMILILAGAIIGDLILLPAMLQSPLARWIGTNRKRKMRKLGV
ncbi:MAG: MMPL family transporter [bacterium]|nr:MMPL family transporter [bacterium]